MNELPAVAPKQSAQKPTQLREVGGFEIGGVFGAVPLGTPYTGDVDMTKPLPPHLVAQLQEHNERSAAREAEPRPAVPQSRASVATRSAQVVAVDSPRSVIKAAKARVKELRAEMKRMKLLQRELAELERLLKAASEKPKSVVRSLRNVG